MIAIYVESAYGVGRVKEHFAVSLSRTASAAGFREGGFGRQDWEKAVYLVAVRKQVVETWI